MWSRWRVLWLSVALLALATASAHAQSTKPPEKGSDRLFQDEGSRLERSNRIWQQSDTCGKDSFRKFPDYTAEAALRRDAYMRDCLRQHHLPPRNDVAGPLKPGS
jgi:hypothetical protein